MEVWWLWDGGSVCFAKYVYIVIIIIMYSHIIKEKDWIVIVWVGGTLYFVCFRIDLELI